MKIFTCIFVVFLSFCFVSVSSADWNDIQPGIDMNEDVNMESVHMNNIDAPIDASEWNEDTKLWLARSCVGEAGFGADDECIGIAWTYATRHKIINGSVSFVSLIRQYSAALKTKSNAKRPWIMGLGLDGKTPKGWPSMLDWNRHAKLWFRLLDRLDEWANGKVSNPVNGADHFGGPMDHNVYNWERVTPDSIVVFRNRFYRSTSN